MAWQHRLSEIDPEDRTAICALCGPTKIGRKGYNKVNGEPQWRCLVAKQEVALNARKPYRKYRGDACEQCGFKAEHPCQLDVHHIDRDHSNNDPANLKTLCANCHRLEHFG